MLEKLDESVTSTTFIKTIKEAIFTTEDKTGFGGIHCPSAPLLSRRKQLQALKRGFY